MVVRFKSTTDGAEFEPSPFLPTMRSPLRRIQWAILEAVNIIEDELATDPVAGSDIDQDDIERTALVFDDLQKLLRGKGFIPEASNGHRARSLDHTRDRRGRQPYRSSSLPISDSMPQPKVCSKLFIDAEFSNHRDPT